MPWQNGDELVSNKQSYEWKFKEVKNTYKEQYKKTSNIKRHEPFINVEYGDLNNNNDFEFRQRQLIVFYD